MTETLTDTLIASLTEDPRGPVALVQRRRLLPVEGEGGVIFPPTYADIGYSIDELADGTKVATIDSVGAQANRLEPLFKKARPGRPENPLSGLVPHVEIVVGNDKVVDLLDVGHRLGDALVRCTELADEARAAFAALLRNGDATAIAKLAPTSLLFGAWDSRETQAKLPRIVQSVIRAWDVDVLHRAAQYNPPIDYVAEGALAETSDKTENDTRSAQGFRHAPAVWRDDARKEQVLGGVHVRGEIRRDVTINLVALRQIGGDRGPDLRAYVLGLALVVAADPGEAFLRQGCLLTPDPAVPPVWDLVGRDGTRRPIRLDPDEAFRIAAAAAATYGVAPGTRSVTFDKARAQGALDAKKDAKAARKAKAAG